jgi:phosphoribosylanthranilate isomerase
MSEIPFKIKICGLTRLQDAQLASDLGAWALGFIFYKESPRGITLEAVRNILKDLKSPTALKIGVFVDEPIDSLIKTVAELKLDGVQLHGNETPSYCKAIKSKNSKLKLFKALRPQSHEDLDRINEYQICDQLLIDTFEKESLGGTGRLSRWDLALKIGRIHPIILAGGLNPDNILNAAREVRPFAFDISSGIESSPGIKSEEKLKLLFGKKNEKLSRF